MKENFYGSHTGFRNDEHHGSEPSAPAAFGPEAGAAKDSELVDLAERFAPSQREIDLYYFYFSSRL